MGKSFFNQGGDHLLLGLVTAAPAEQAAHEREDEDEGEGRSQSAALLNDKPHIRRDKEI